MLSLDELHYGILYRNQGLYFVDKLCKKMKLNPTIPYYLCLIASPVQESVVYVEGDIVVVVCVASKQNGTRVTVERVADKAHRAGHCRHNNLVTGARD